MTCSLHHIFVRTSFIGRGAIPFNIHPPRFGWHFPRSIWKLFPRGGGGGVGWVGNRWSLKKKFLRGIRKTGLFLKGGLWGYLWSFLVRGIRVSLSHPKGGGDQAIKWNGLRSIPCEGKRWKTYRSSRASTFPLSPLSPPAQILLADKAFKCIT